MRTKGRGAEWNMIKEKRKSGGIRGGGKIRAMGE